MQTIYLHVTRAPKCTVSADAGFCRASQHCRTASRNKGDIDTTCMQETHAEHAACHVPCAAWPMAAWGYGNVGGPAHRLGRLPRAHGRRLAHEVQPCMSGRPLSMRASCAILCTVGVERSTRHVRGAGPSVKTSEAAHSCTCARTTTLSLLIPACWLIFQAWQPAMPVTHRHAGTDGVTSEPSPGAQRVTCWGCWGGRTTRLGSGCQGRRGCMRAGRSPAAAPAPAARSPRPSGTRRSGRGGAGSCARPPACPHSTGSLHAPSGVCKPAPRA
jgi:hypothetical protein